MGDFVMFICTLALVVPLAYGLLGLWRAWLRGRRCRARLLIRVYPGSAEHLAALRTVDQQTAPIFSGWPRTGAASPGRRVRARGR